MIHANRIVTVGEQECIIDRPIVLYRGDREVEIEFTLVGNEFMFSEEGNVIKSVNASHGQLVLNTPSGEHMFSELAECHEGKVVFVVTKEMIDEFIEMGFYSFQIRLYDSAEMKSRVTIPPVMNGIDIRNPIAAEDETNVVDQGIVDYARIFKDQSNEELPTFDWTGAYIKTEWVHHDVITENKMNKIEDALYSINANVKESDAVMFNTLDKVKKDADKYVKEHMAEVEADVEEFERNLNTGVEQFKIDTNAAMTAHRNEVSEVTNILNDNSTDTNNISIEHGEVNYFSFVTNSSKIKGVTLNDIPLKIYDKYNNTYRNVPEGAIKENVVYNVKYNNEFYEIFIENIYDRVIIECGRDKEIVELNDALKFARNFKCSAFDIVSRVTIVIQAGINYQTKKVYISTEDSRYIEIVGENALTGEMASYYPISNLTWSSLQTTDDNRGILNIWKSSFGEIRGIEFKLNKVMNNYLDCFLYLMNANEIHFEQCVIDLTDCTGNEVNGIVAIERSSFRATGLEKDGMLDRCVIKMPVNGGNRAVVVNGLSVGNINNIEIINKCVKGVLVDTNSDVLALKLKATLADIPIHVNYGKVTTNDYTIKDDAKFIIENYGEIIDLSTDKKGLNLSNYRKNTDGSIELFNTTKVNASCTTSWAGLYTGGLEIALPTLFKEIKSVSVSVYTDDGVTALSSVSKVSLTSIGVSIYRPASTPSRSWNISYSVIGY